MRKQLFGFAVLLCMPFLTIALTNESAGQDLKAFERRLGGAVEAGELSMEQAIKVLKTLSSLPKPGIKPPEAIPHPAATQKADKEQIIIQFAILRLAAKRAELIQQYGKSDSRVAAVERAILAKTEQWRAKSPIIKLPIECYEEVPEEPLYDDHVALIKSRARATLIASGMSREKAATALKICESIAKQIETNGNLSFQPRREAITLLAKESGYDGGNFDLLVGISRRLARIQAITKSLPQKDNRQGVDDDRNETDVEMAKSLEKILKSPPEKIRQAVSYQKEWNVELAKKIRDLESERAELLDLYGPKLGRIAVIDKHLIHYRKLLKIARAKLEAIDEEAKRTQYNKLQVAPPA